MPPQKPIDKFIARSLSLLQKDFIVIGKERVPSFVAWPIIMFIVGIVVTVAFLASRSDELQLANIEAAKPLSQTGEIGDPQAMFHVTCNDVRRGQDVAVQPFTGQVSNQFERRAMAEKRLFDCMWRAYRYVQALQKDNPQYKKETDLALNQAQNWGGRAIRRYQSLTVRTLASPKNVRYAVGKGGYVWIYPPHGMGALRDALRLAPDWVAAHPDEQVMAFLDAKISNGKVVPANTKPTKQTVTKGNKEEIMLFGVIKTDMKFEPLTPTMIEMLDEAQQLHTKWTLAVLERKGASELQQLVMDHHEVHEMLLAMSRSADERSLVSLNIHTPHEICWDYSDVKIDNMIIELDDIHAKWTDAVKNLDFLGAWTNGLRHSRLHAMLATCGLKLAEVLDLKDIDLKESLDTDLTAEELESVGYIEEEIDEAL